MVEAEEVLEELMDSLDNLDFDRILDIEREEGPSDGQVEGGGIPGRLPKEQKCLYLHQTKQKPKFLPVVVGSLHQVAVEGTDPGEDSLEVVHIVREEYSPDLHLEGVDHILLVGLDNLDLEVVVVLVEDMQDNESGIQDKCVEGLLEDTLAGEGVGKASHQEKDARDMVSFHHVGLEGL